MSGSIFMTWLVIAGRPVVNTLRGSTRRLSFWSAGSRWRRRPVSWRPVSAARTVRPAGMPSGRLRGSGGGAAACHGVHGQAARAAGRAGAGARRSVGADYLLGGHPGAGGILVAGPQRASAQVSERAVETQFVFDRHGAAELSVAYRILVPERRHRIGGAAGKASPCDEQCGDLRPGVVGPAEGTADHRLPDGGTARARRAAGT